MKIVRKICIVLLGIILLGLISAFFLSYSIKDIVNNKMMGSAAKELVIPYIESNNNLTSDERELINDFLNNKSTDKIMGNFVEDILDSLSSGKKVEEDLVNNIFDSIIKNKEEIEDSTGQKIDVEQLQRIKNSDDVKILSKKLSDVLNQEYDKLNPSNKSLIKTYNYFVSDDFRQIVLIGIIFNIILIILVQWSLYKWLSVVGKSILMSGISLTIIFFFINSILKEMFTRANLLITIDANSVLIIGIILIIFGVLAIILYKILDKVISTKK